MTATGFKPEELRGFSAGLRHRGRRSSPRLFWFEGGNPSFGGDHFDRDSCFAREGAAVTSLKTEKHSPASIFPSGKPRYLDFDAKA